MSSHIDLRARRVALRATEEMMAAGIGVRLTEVFEIERHEAPDSVLHRYSVWLSRMERWSPEERARQLAAAEGGRRFLIRI